ncbi:hypothetical protein ACHQM5_018118 [Ranunculus cassubicifolius]
MFFIELCVGYICRRPKSCGIRCKASTTPFPLLQISKEHNLTESKDKNFLYSPCSMQLALSMLANGAKGSTLEELLAFLEADTLNQLNSVANEMVQNLTQWAQLSFASGVWLDKSLDIKPEFRTACEKIYRSKAESVDFQKKNKEVRGNINQWAADATNGQIQHFLPEYAVTELTKFVLANALYFKGKWLKPFRKSSTKNQDFHLLGGNSVKVPFMSSYKDTQYMETFDEFKVIRLPYRNCNLSMYIILPHKRDGLWEVAEKMGSDPLFLQKYTSFYGAVEVERLKIPKFVITHMFKASEVVKALGLKTCFTCDAELSEMVQNLRPGEWLEVNEIYHKSHIEVDEEGTEAAAVTAIGLCTGDSPPPPVTPVEFVADHPFMFMIRDGANGMVMFTGHVLNPLLE